MLIGVACFVLVIATYCSSSRSVQMKPQSLEDILMTILRPCQDVAVIDIEYFGESQARVRLVTSDTYGQSLDILSCWQSNIEVRRNRGRKIDSWPIRLPGNQPGVCIVNDLGFSKELILIGGFIE